VPLTPEQEGHNRYIAGQEAKARRGETPFYQPGKPYVHYPANQRRRKFVVTLKDGTKMYVTAHDEADARQLVNGTRTGERDARQLVNGTRTGERGARQLVNGTRTGERGGGSASVEKGKR
jgi:hypothetical protein